MRILFAVLMTLFIAFFTQTSSGKVALAPTCALASEGIFQGLWVKHRIYSNEKVIYGANDMNSILSELENLRGQGLCR